MRRVKRLVLSGKVQQYLVRKSAQASNSDVQKEWKCAQQTAIIGDDLFGVLRKMAGKRERCMYCNDSRGTDIEHFWPKAIFCEKTFRWENMLLVCAGCNRKKGNRFPMDSDGMPLLIDPSVDEPWLFVDFVPETGELAARWRVDIDRSDPKGEATTDPTILPLNIEAVTSGRQRYYRNLCKVVEAFLQSAKSDDGSASEAAFEQLSNDMVELSDFGLNRWLFHFSDHSAEPLRDLCSDYPEHWQRLRDITSLE